MSTHRSPFAGAILLAAGLAASSPMPSRAQADADAWKWELAVYGWFPGISATTSFPTGASGPSIDISADSVIDALKFAAMGSFGGKKGKWGFWSDFVYSDVGGSKQQSRDFSLGGQGIPANLSANLVLDMKSVFWTMAGTYELAATPANTTDLLFGARLADIRETLSWSVNGSIAGTGLPGQSGSVQVDMSNWDAIVGVKGVAYLDAERRWLVPYYLDIGTGQSQFTWQANLGIGYRFDWGATVLSWRYLDYEMKSGVPIQSMSMSGPLLGLAWRW
ncbi:MAG: hypothetical protein J0L57_01360 [Burkholderiales bacterium]|nr:hypothetical protein [Burkholderiales bacterium]